MNVDDALYALVHDYPGGSESLAPRIGTTAATLRSKVSLKITTHIPTVRDMRRLVGVSGDLRPLHALAQEFDHVMLPMPDSDAADDMAVLEAFAVCWSRNGDLAHLVHQALCDGDLTADEMKRIRQAVYRAQGALSALANRVGAMAEPEAERTDG